MLAKNPLPAELQGLQQLFQSGQLLLAETHAQQLLLRYPKSLPVLNLLGMCQQAQGKLQAAAGSFRKMLTLDARIAEIHFNLATIQTQLKDYKAALAYYRKALQLKPEFTMAHFNLGALLQQQGLPVEAARHYEVAVTQQPGFYEAWLNWGAVLQLRGELRRAEACYRKALTLQTDADAYFNLGTSLYGLGETFRDQGVMDEAVRCYREALRVEPGHDRANYNLGECFALSSQFALALQHFSVSAFADAKERVLLCLYKTGQFAAFKLRLDELSVHEPANSVLLGSLSTHYALNFEQPNTYGFCREPMAFVQVTQIEELARPGSEFLAQLLHDIKHLAIAERKQGRLYYGMQSAGNLLQRTEPSFQTLAGLIRSKVLAYRQFFAGSEEGLIRWFPQELEFASSWYLRMKQGGYLTSHIHEEGWISGCVYLQLPDKLAAHEGSFEYGVDGDDYPRLREDFPSQIVDQKVGDLVLFPSSLFHRTLPFHSDQERVCIAFDIKPQLAYS